MIALTQEKREELIACANEIKKMATSTHGYKVGNDAFGRNALMLMEVALASITAQPFGYIEEDAVKDRERLFSAQVFADEEDLPSYEFSELSYPLYLAPPVPEIKLPDEHEGIEHTEYHSGKQAGWNECLSEIKRLNGLGD
ncbi:hypothetical protein [Rosenbergiella australiborealis]|uniref:hypothetical protein n=1 Tax=Rosenbergiella australiborealis TaxID=1544696 RepID=UPI001F4E9D56|nr:hypothetical protein [Rosenbergiella australiborealis]